MPYAQHIPEHIKNQMYTTGQVRNIAAAQALLRQTLIPALFLTSIVRCKRSRTAVRQDQAIRRTTRCSPSRRRRSLVPTHALTSRERTTTSSPPVPIVNCRRDIYIARRARLPRHSTRSIATNHCPRLETRTRTRFVEETRG